MVWYRGEEPPTTFTPTMFMPIIDEFIYVAGVRDLCDNDLPDIYRFDLKNNTWEKYDEKPESYGQHVLVKVGDKILIGPGRIRPHGSWVRSVYLYDPIQKTFTQLADFPEDADAGRAPTPSTDKDGLVYFIGCSVISNSYILDTNSNTYTSFSKYPINAAWMTADWLDEEKTAIICFGGTAWGGSDHSDVYLFDLASHTFTKITDMPYRAFMAVVKNCDGKIYMVGGKNSPASAKYIFHTETYIYDYVSNTFIRLDDLPIPVGILSTAYDGRRLIILTRNLYYDKSGCKSNLVFMREVKYDG